MSRSPMELAMMVAVASMSARQWTMPAPPRRNYGTTVQNLAKAKALTKKQRVCEQIRARRNLIKGGA